jgi:hypothetical protein
MTSENEFEAFLRIYQSAFETLEPDRIVPFYNVPSGGISAEKITMLNTVEAIYDNFRTVTADLRKYGLAKTRYELAPVRIISPSIVELPVDWSLFRADGSLITQMKVVYVLWRAPAGLKIALVYSIAP